MNALLKIIIKSLLPLIIDFLVVILSELAKKSDNTIDDNLVNTLKDNKQLIVEFGKTL